MNKIAFLLILLCSSAFTMAQSITDGKEWKDLITNFDNENWPEAKKLSVDCLKKAKGSEEEGEIVPMLRYIIIYAEAGLLNMNKVTKTDALKAVKDFQGQLITLPAHPVATKNAFNSVQMHNNKTDTLFLTITNKKATEIFSFEYIVLKDKWPVEDFKRNEGKNFRLLGRLTSISVEGNMFPRFRIIVDNGEYKSFD